MNKRLLPILNLLVLFGTIFLSYYSNTGAMNGNTMGSLSNEYENLFTPAGYAFSIWGFIYLGLLGNAIYQLIKYKNEDIQVQSSGLIIANLANCAWVFLWLYEFTAWSTLAMSILLFALLRLSIKLNIGFKKKPFWSWWPISIYTGWIVVALVANITAYLSKIGWTGGIQEAVWAFTIIAFSLITYLFLLIQRRLSYAAYVGVWAFIAIAVEQWYYHPSVAYVATLACIILLIATIWKDVKISLELEKAANP